LNILIAGGTGFIGSALVDKLTGRGNQVTILSRKIPAHHERNKLIAWALWDGRRIFDPETALKGITAVVNLSGEPVVGKRWSRDQKEKIRNSRIYSTRAILEAIKGLEQRPSVWVNASAVGYYGNVSEVAVSEDAEAGSGFLAQTCAAWEKEAVAAEALGLRVVRARIGIVLGKKGGMLERMLLPFRLGLGTVPGSGKQMLPWIHIHDIVDLFLFAIEKGEISGPLNMTAPEPVRMGDFCKVLAGILRRPCFFKVPDGLLRMGLGEMATVLLEGQRAIPAKALQHGFVFRYGDLNKALESIVSS